MANNKSLHSAKVAKNDEFYTRREDIEAELQHYADQFEGKRVYCNCDDPETSEFWQFFKRMFRPWKLKSLVATHFEPCAENFAYKLELSEDTNGDGTIDWNDEPVITQIECSGDFRDEICIKLLDDSDIVVTNPPFSLFRQYVEQLMEHDKKFLVIGNKNAITYKEIFPLIKSNQLWVGYTPMSKDMFFDVKDEYAKYLVENKKEGSAYRVVNGKVRARASAIWFTNLDIPKRHEPIDLRGNYYDPEKYPHYDNYDAIEVSKVADIPCDYEPGYLVPVAYRAWLEDAGFILGHERDNAAGERCVCVCVAEGTQVLSLEMTQTEWCNGIMGVPITFLGKYCPEQFQIVRFRKGLDEKDLTVNGRTPYFRILIRRMMPNGATA